MHPWPLYVSVQGCNVLISDSLQEDAQVRTATGAGYGTQVIRPWHLGNAVVPACHDPEPCGTAASCGAGHRYVEPWYSPAKVRGTSLGGILGGPPVGCELGL